MKLVLKNLLRTYLKIVSKTTIFLHKPVIIAIAGSTNKTFTKNEITNILKKEGINARGNSKSFNTDVGLSLAILNLPSGYNSFKNWLPVIKKSLGSVLNKNFPKVLVLELGISDPGDAKFLFSIIKPQIMVITEITQKYLESFGDMDNLAEEYQYILDKLPKKSLLIFNNDNQRIRNLNKPKCQTISFGTSSDSNWKICSIIKNKNDQKININGHKDVFTKKQGIHNAYALIPGLIIQEKFSKTNNYENR